MQPRRPKHRSHIEEFQGKEAMPATFAPGRRCRSCGCRLSVYNDLDRCWPCHPQGRTLSRIQERSTFDDFVELMEEEAA